MAYIFLIKYYTVVSLYLGIYYKTSCLVRRQQLQMLIFIYKKMNNLGTYLMVYMY